jgi:hypothetical protein
MRQVTGPMLGKTIMRRERMPDGKFTESLSKWHDRRPAIASQRLGSENGHEKIVAGETEIHIEWSCRPFF